MLNQDIMQESSIWGNPDERFCPNPAVMDKNPKMKKLLQTVEGAPSNGFMQMLILGMVKLLGKVKMKGSKPQTVKEKFFETLRYLEAEQKTKGEDKAKTKEMVGDKKPKNSIRACFGPATECSNCKNKGADLLQFPPNDEDHVLLPNNKALSGFKRCSACHVVAYCSEVKLFTRFVCHLRLFTPLDLRIANESIGSTIIRRCARFSRRRRSSVEGCTQARPASPAVANRPPTGST